MIEEKVAVLEEKMGACSFWNDQESANKTITELKELKGWYDPIVKLTAKFQRLKSDLPEIEELADPGLNKEFEKELSDLESDLEGLEIRRMLSGKLDGNNCYFTINSGAGGTEACDWAEMLSRMYTRWMINRGWGVEFIESTPGDIAGYKSITYKVSGQYAYGYCKAEKGVHRLVRNSPFDSSGKRHTSFASVDVSPEIDDDVPIEIRPEDLRVDTFRASGAGGQHVNTTDSAVRMTHLPTHIVVYCQGERSQIKNRETCMKMLRAKLYEKQLADREKELKAISGEKKEISFGSQIRNYVFSPYTLVKDDRTNVQVGNVQAVMDGDLDPFVNAYLKEFGGK